MDELYEAQLKLNAEATASVCEAVEEDGLVVLYRDGVAFAWFSLAQWQEMVDEETQRR